MAKVIQNGGYSCRDYPMMSAGGDSGQQHRQTPLGREETKMKFKTLAVFIGVMVLFFGVTPFIEKSTAKTISLKFSSPWPPMHPQHKMAIEPWAKEPPPSQQTPRIMPINNRTDSADILIMYSNSF